VLHTDSKVVSG
jgi:hypothetical protein